MVTLIGLVNLRRPVVNDGNRRKKESGNLAQSWLNPNILTLSPWIWLDASDDSTITQSGGFVSQWNDKSGNGRNVSNGSVTSQPTIGTITLNGLNTIGFNRLNDRLSITSTGLISNLTSYSFFCVANYRITPIAAHRFWDVNNNRLVSYSTIAAVSSSASYSTSGMAFSSPNGSFPINTWTKVSSVWTGGSIASESSIRLNNSEQILTTTNGTGTLNSSASNSFWVGNRSTIDRGFNGQMGEFIFFNRALVHSERKLIELYLQNKWGI